MSPPAPPSASGIGTPSRPSSAALRNSASGKRPCASSSSATGATTPSANPRTVSRKSRCSSERSRSTLCTIPAAYDATAWTPARLPVMPTRSCATGCSSGPGDVLAAAPRADPARARRRAHRGRLPRRRALRRRARDRSAHHARARARSRPRTRSTGAPRGRTRACASSCARARASSGSPAARIRRCSPTCRRRAPCAASSTARACRPTGAPSGAPTRASPSSPGRRPPGRLRSTPSSSPMPPSPTLGNDLLRFARLGADDPADGWRRHAEHLAERAARLTALDLREIRLKAPGTDLHLALPGRHALARRHQRRARPPHHAEHPHRGGVHEPRPVGDDRAVPLHAPAGARRAA